jgi:predicted membrane GTPase involved in stress response
VLPTCLSIRFADVEIAIVVHRDMKRRSVWIQIEISNAFSVGAKDDSLSVPVIWASGAAGWFEISPADVYQSICDTMFQGVCLHYSLLDQYEEGLEMLQKSKRKKRATFADVNLSLNELLFRVCYNPVHMCPRSASKSYMDFC